MPHLCCHVYLLIQEKRKLQRQYRLLLLLLSLFVSLLLWVGVTAAATLLEWLVLTGITGALLLIIFLIAYIFSTTERVRGLPDKYNQRFLLRINLQLLLLLPAAGYFFFIRPTLLAQDEVTHHQSFIGTAGNAHWQLGTTRIIELNYLTDAWLKSELRGRKEVLYQNIVFDTAYSPYDSVFSVEVLFRWEGKPNEISYRMLVIKDGEAVRDSAVSADWVTARIALLNEKARQEQATVDSLYQALKEEKR